MMQNMGAKADPIPSMNGFLAQSKTTVQRFAGGFLILALLGALWSTALTRLSERTTAVTLLTRAGSDIVNPFLIANGSGMAQASYQQLQASAKAHPNAVLNIPFLKVPIVGREIVGKNFADGSRIIYAHVAASYYDGGPNAAFVLPAQLQPIVSNYTPFVQSSKAISSPFPALPIPQLPAFATQLYTTVGITPTTLTADGHKTALVRSQWLWGISILLALLLVALSSGWERLWRVAWPLFHSAWHVTLIGIIGTVLIRSKPVQAAPYMSIVDLIGNTFMPVFYVATALGLMGIIVSIVGKRLTTQDAMEPARQVATPNTWPTPAHQPDGPPAEPPMQPYR